MTVLVSLVFFLFFWPAILGGIIFGLLGHALLQVCDGKLLLMGVWLMTVAMWLKSNQPDPDSPFMNLPQIIATSHVMGISTPLIMMLISAVVLALAFFVKMRGIRS